MKLQWFAMPNSIVTTMTAFLFPRMMSKREENGKKQIIVFFFTV